MLRLPLAVASNKCRSRVHQEWKGVYSWRRTNASFAVECWIILFPASLPELAASLADWWMCSLLWWLGGWEVDWWHTGDGGSLPVAGEQWRISCAGGSACAGCDARGRGLVADDRRVAAHLLHGGQRARAGALARGWLDVLWRICRVMHGTREEVGVGIGRDAEWSRIEREYPNYSWFIFLWILCWYVSNACPIRIGIGYVIQDRTLPWRIGVT